MWQEFSEELSQGSFLSAGNRRVQGYRMTTESPAIQPALVVEQTLKMDNFETRENDPGVVQQGKVESMPKPLRNRCSRTREALELQARNFTEGPLRPSSYSLQTSPKDPVRPSG